MYFVKKSEQNRITQSILNIVPLYQKCWRNRVKWNNYHFLKKNVVFISRQGLKYFFLSEPVIPYYCGNEGKVTGQKEMTLPMRKLIRSGTVLGGSADLLFTQRFYKLVIASIFLK